MLSLSLSLFSLSLYLSLSLSPPPPLYPSLSYAIHLFSAFSSKDLNHWLEKVVPISIWIGAITLGLEILKAALRSIVYERGIVRKVRNLLGCVIFGAVAAGIFSISLVSSPCFSVTLTQPNSDHLVSTT